MKHLHPSLPLAVSLLALLPAGWTSAHQPVYGVGTQTLVTVHEDRVVLIFDLSYGASWAHAEMMRVDSDRDSQVDAEEADAYLESQWRRKVAPSLGCRIDGQDVELRLVSAEHKSLVGEVAPFLFMLLYTVEARPVAGGSLATGGPHSLEIEDVVVKGETPGLPRFLVPYEGHGSGQRLFRPRFVEPSPAFLGLQHYQLDGEKLHIEFDFAEGEVLEVLPPVEAPSSGDARPPGRPAEAAGDDEYREAQAAARLILDVARGRLGFWEIVLFVGLALLYGAGHAFTPGHGKSMVAAYLVGTQGRVRDAVILGLVTTATHTITVYIIGVILLAAAHYSVVSQGALENRAILVCALLSGLFLVVLGLALFFRRYRRLRMGLAALESHSHGHGHSHSHTHAGAPAGSHSPTPSHEHAHGSHEHAHGHSHSHGLDAAGDAADPAGDGRRASPAFAGERPRVRELIALGFSGGVLPCPAGLTVIAIGLQYPEHLGWALLFLVFFSLGLGAVLVAIGVLLVSGKLLARGNLREGVFFRELSFLRRVFTADFLAALDRLGVRAVRVTPAFSCLFIAALGAYFATSAGVRAEGELLAMLSTLRSWIAP